MTHPLPSTDEEKNEVVCSITNAYISRELNKLRNIVERSQQEFNAMQSISSEEINTLERHIRACIVGIKAMCSSQNTIKSELCRQCDSQLFT